MMSTARNFIINLSGSLVGLVLFAALTPIYLHTIGAERYGVVTVILSLSMYVSSFNFGMGPALIYHIAGDLKDDVAAQSEAFWSAMALTTPVGIVASLVIFGLLPIGLADLMHLTPAIRREMNGAALPLIGIGLCTILHSNVRGLWAGRQAFLTLAITGSIEVTFTVLGPVLTAMFISASIPALLYATLAVRVVALSGSTVLCMSKMLANRAPRFSIARIRSLMGFGGWVTIQTFVETVVSSADRLVLSTISGAQQVPIYGIPLSVASRSMLIPSSLLGGLFPKMVATPPENRADLLMKTLRFLLLLTPGYVIVAAAAPTLLRYWISPGFADAATWSLQLMAIAFWLEMVAAIYSNELYASGNARANFVVAIAIVVPYLVALAAGAWWLGATGVAMAYLMRNVLLLSLRARFARQSLSSVMPIAINLVPLVIVAYLAPHSWTGLTMSNTLLAAGFTFLSVLACLLTRPRDLLAFVRSVVPTRFQTGHAVTAP